MADLSHSVRELLQLHAAGRFVDMEKRARAYLKSAPGIPLLNEFIGIALTGQGRHDDALPYLDKAARREPTDAQFWENLGLCQRELDRFQEAESSLRRALALRASSVEALNALGSVLRSLERPDEARSMFERALALAPQHAGAHFNLGKMFAQRGDWAAAEAAYRRAIALDPANAGPRVTLAELLFFRRRKPEAVDAAATAFDMLGAGARPVTRATLPLLDSLADVFEGLGAVSRALAIRKATYAFRPAPSRALQTAFVARRMCDWDYAARVEPVALQAADEPRAPWFTLAFESATAARQLELARGFSQALAKHVTPMPVRPVASEHKKIRLGYFSADFGNHAVTHLISGVIEEHDRDRFEVVGYDIASSTPETDEFRARLDHAFDRIVKLGDLTDPAAAQKLVEDEIDIVIDLNGWTLGHRAGVLARRPVPVQIQWLGYSGTLGAPWIDYIVADAVLIGPQDERFYSEKVLRLPDTFLPSDDKQHAGDRGARAQHGLPEGAFVFGCFNQPYKITAPVFDTWMRLLAAVENSVLWLIDPKEEVREVLRRRAAAQGIAPERLVFASFIASTLDHRARIGHADLALDCFPYGSHTTASDALLAGVPMVALKGETFASRVSASILNAAGLQDLIATELEGFYERAVGLARDAQALAAMRNRLGGLRFSPPFETRRFARNLEAAYSTAWNRHSSGLSPISIDVAPGS